jgi:hypothetical protein
MAGMLVFFAMLIGANIQLALEQDIEAAKSGKPKGKAAIKAAMKKKKKAAGDDSDESDVFQPVKPKAAAKPKPAAKASPSKRPRSAISYWGVRSKADVSARTCLMEMRM